MVVMAIRGRECANRAHEVLLEAKRANSDFGIFVEVAKDLEEVLRMAITRPSLCSRSNYCASRDCESFNRGRESV
jgi:hypothetical protein